MTQFLQNTIRNNGPSNNIDAQNRSTKNRANIKHAIIEHASKIIIPPPKFDFALTGLYGDNLEKFHQSAIFMPLEHYEHLVGNIPYQKYDICTESGGPASAQVVPEKA